MLNNQCLCNLIFDKLTFSRVKLVDAFSRNCEIGEICTTETYVIGNEFQVDTYPFLREVVRDEKFKL